MMDVEYNGILASSLGIYAKNIPDIPAAVRKEKTVDIPGMDGTLILLEGAMNPQKSKWILTLLEILTDGMNVSDLQKNGCQKEVDCSGLAVIRSITTRF